MLLYLRYLCFVFFPCSLFAQTPAAIFQLQHYICYQITKPLEIDGKLLEEDWLQANWTTEFIDIQGTHKPKPRYKTQVKMLWDQEYFYIAAQLEEPDIWATLTKPESVIFQDNDFEVFIDPDGDTHMYYEFEINALGTVWDLLLTKPYRDGGKPINNWDIEGLKTSIHIEGSLNNPLEKDKYWTIEMAFPWDVLKEAAAGNRKPIHGDQWRVNFSRVQWQTEIINNTYQKKVNPATNKSYPEDNWVWSPQGVINMHQPETWGIVQFSGNMVGRATDKFLEPEDEKIKWALHQIYYAQKQWKKTHQAYTNQLSDLRIPPVTIEGYSFEPKLLCTQSLFEVTAKSLDGKAEWHIRHDGLIWKERLVNE